MVGLILSLLLAGPLFGNTIKSEGGFGEAEKLKMQIDRIEKEYDRLTKEYQNIKEQLMDACAKLDEVNQEVGTSWMILDIEDCTLFKLREAQAFPVSIEEPKIVSKADVEQQMPRLKLYGKAIGFLAGALGVLLLFGSVASSLWKEKYLTAGLQAISAIFLFFILWMMVNA